MYSILWLAVALLLSSGQASNVTSPSHSTGSNIATTANNSIGNSNSSSSSSSSSNVNGRIVVPLLLVNLNLSAIKTASNTYPSGTFPKVPLRRNATDSGESFALPISSSSSSSSASSQSSSSSSSSMVLLSLSSASASASATAASTPTPINDVKQLVQNIESRLRRIRDVEMRVATIQEIFDSMHFSSSPLTYSVRNGSDGQQHNNMAIASMDHDLQLFSKRMAKKLEKAIHVVQDMRDFFRFNITRLLPQRKWSSLADYNEEEEDEQQDDEEDDNELDTEAEIDREIDEFDGITPAEEIVENAKLYLDTIIEACQTLDEVSASESNYNKQQIQILNYLKTDRAKQQHHYANDILNEDNERSLQANAYIIDKLNNLKATLTTAELLELPTTMDFGHAGGFQTTKQLRFLGNHFKHIYFLSTSDHASDHNEQYFYDINFRHLYVSAIKSKYVFLMLDIGAPINDELLELTKSYVANVLQLLSDSDLITIVTVADEPKAMTLSSYATVAVDGIYYATRDTKDDILSYLSHLQPVRSFTNHSWGFKYAFELLQAHQNASVITLKNPIDFVYITRGLLTNLSDSMHVLRVIAEGQAGLLQPIIINMCGIIIDEKRLMHERQFLADIATQNYSKYEISVSDWLGSQTPNSLNGQFFVLTKRQTDLLMRAATAIFTSSFEERYLAQSCDVHTQIMDTNSRDAIVSITHSVAPFGVVGVNLFLSDLLEDIVNYHQRDQYRNKNGFVYGFLIDRNGMTVAHPAFPRPMAQNQKPYPVDIAFLENSTDFTTIRHRMLQDENGNITTTAYILSNRKPMLMERSYRWQSVLNIYILCLVATTQRMTAAGGGGSLDNGNPSAGDPDENLKSPLMGPTAMPITLRGYPLHNEMTHFQHTEYEFVPSMDLLFHRLDLLPPTDPHVCRYFRQMATFDAATLFLSAAAFESPFTFLHNNRISSLHTQQRIAESIMTYFKVSTSLVATPGLRPQIRHEVNALYNAMQHLKKRHQDARGPLKNFIIRRYIATVNGVLQVYPGTLLSNNYDPTRRPWFRKAMEQPGKVITTEPYLDAGGAGYIVTIAHTIFEGKSNALHSVERDQPVAIVALDMPYAYYYKMIIDTTPLCQLKNIKCLLFEDRGYLLAHPSMLEPSTVERNQRRPYEHLTHKESYLANDILNHKILVRKMACTNYQNRTLQRYYVFNTSLSDILTNVVQGERTKYAITLVRGTNIFAAVLNSTCDGGAFCPCSTIDRTCLNCKRMDQNECECPCECPMEWDGMFGDPGNEFGNSMDDSSASPFSNYTQQYGYCEPPSESFVELPATSELSVLPPCLSINCDIYTTHHECLAVMGCEWCQQDLDGNGFSASFCSAQSSCFNGVLASITPYGDFDDLEIIAAHGYGPGQKQSTYSALGPVGGAVIVLAIVIGFAIYCYRHNIDTNGQDQFYMDSMQEENYGLPLSRFNFDDCQAHDDPPGNAYDHPTAQRNLMNPADISPYHVSTGSSYRRPPNGESDHGYSTMTPHEDSSDHQCFTLAEPLLLSDKRNSKSDTLSISTSISSPTNRHQQPQHHPYPPSLQSASTTKELRYNLTSPTKRPHGMPTLSGAGSLFEQTTLPLNDSNEEPIMGQRYILAPVTVHRHMETSES